METEIGAEKAEVPLLIYEGEIGEERRDIELVVSHDDEYWHPPKSQGVAVQDVLQSPLQWIKHHLSNQKSLPFHLCLRLII